MGVSGRSLTAGSTGATDAAIATRARATDGDTRKSAGAITGVRISSSRDAASAAQIATANRIAASGVARDGVATGRAARDRGPANRTPARRGTTNAITGRVATAGCRVRRATAAGGVCSVASRGGSSVARCSSRTAGTTRST
jgi:hypothetical protein